MIQFDVKAVRQVRRRTVLVNVEKPARKFSSAISSILQSRVESHQPSVHHLASTARISWISLYTCVLHRVPDKQCVRGTQVDKHACLCFCLKEKIALASQSSHGHLEVPLLK